jgi:uncharacterized OB-fold protein
LSTKPAPVVDHLSEPFWRGCRENRLLIQACDACGTPRFPPGPLCLACGSDRSRWIEASGRGRIYSWIVVRHPVPAEIYASEVPYVVALVELDEGVRMPTNVVGCAPEGVTAGMRVEVCFRDVGDVRLAQFRPVEREAPA